ncbi:MAG TPA: hypothetical protein VK168_19335 [Saprospiraceae bacterium]|nr:hypothetical protein [Saprospiraceae bacterium]
MKKLLFAIPVVVAALIFAFCTKADVQTDLAQVVPDGPAADRGVCTLINNPVNAAATLTVCGTNLNLQQCQQCGPGNPKGTGVAVFPGGLINLTLNTPIEISITTDVRTALNLNAGNGGPGPIPLDAGECRRFRIEDNCTITPL